MRAQLAVAAWRGGDAGAGLFLAEGGHADRAVYIYSGQRLPKKCLAGLALPGAPLAATVGNVAEVKCGGTPHSDTQIQGKRLEKLARLEPT